MSASSAVFVKAIRQTSCRLLAINRNVVGNATLLQARHQPARTYQRVNAFRFLSTAAEDASDEQPKKESKPIIPGIGKGKTSTGYVRS